MRRTWAALVLLFAGWNLFAQDQSVHSKEVSIAYSYSPDSSHILIGAAEQRRLFTADISYFHPLRSWQFARLEYAAELSPFFRISDPALAGIRCFVNGSPLVLQKYSDPQRVIFVSHAPTGAASGLPCTTLYLFYSRQTTDGVSFSPIGARMLLAPKSFVSPYLIGAVGLALSSRDIPISQSARFNYVLTVGAGVRVQETRRLSTDLDYRYMHISNGNHGIQNPGIDMGNIRVGVGYRF
jgi:hypothetical protein